MILHEYQIGDRWYLPYGCQTFDPVEAGDRCTGRCCWTFPLPWTHEQHAEYLRGEVAPPNAEDIDMILSMVVPDADNPGYYTCRLFDGENCTAYEARPDMCKGFPYGRFCEHMKACTWDDGRKGRHDRDDRQRLRLRVLTASEVN